MAVDGEGPRGFGSSHDDPPNRGRGRTPGEAAESAVRRLVASGGAKHGDVLSVTMYVTVANPRVGEYIVDLGGN